MARCTNEVLLKKIGLANLSKSTEVRFRVRRDLPDCRKINTKNHIETSQKSAQKGGLRDDVTTYTYNKYTKPINQFECGRTGCVNSGTLTVSASGTATYFAQFDATEWAAGVITLYVKVASFPQTLTVRVSDDSTFTDADVYDITLTSAAAGDDGFVPVFVDLSTTPDSTDGNGWDATAKGAYIQFSTGVEAGYSSISIYDSYEDFAVEDTVLISCLSSIGGSYDVETIEETCQVSRYNDSVSTLTFPVTGTQATPNYWKLNPMLAKGENSKGVDDITIKKTIATYSSNSDYGAVTVADLKQNECGGVAVQIEEACDVSEATLDMISAPVLVYLDEGHFQVIKNQDGSSDIIFNKALVGQEVLITYPREVDIEEYVANPDNLNGTHVAMYVPRETSDHVKFVDVFENVFVTSFPATIGSDSTEFAFTLTIGRDEDGNFFRTQKILS